MNFGNKSVMLLSSLRSKFRLLQKLCNTMNKYNNIIITVTSIIFYISAHFTVFAPQKYFN